MSARIIDGKAVATEVKAATAERAREFAARFGRRPSLHVLLVGDDPASQVYVGSKEKQAGAVGIDGAVHRLSAETQQSELESRVAALSADPNVDGILVQLPLPKHLDSQRVLDVLDARKDVDGLTPISAGLLWGDRPGLRPCTPFGCMRLLQHTGVSLEGARAVVVGRSALVGKPIAAMLLAANATVTLAHSRTRDLAARVSESDVVIAAVGRPELIRGEWIREGAVVIDVGINRNEAGKLIGDVEFAAASERAGWLTPVPGGVGPMTIAMLLSNTVDAAFDRALHEGPPTGQ